MNNPQSIGKTIKNLPVQTACSTVSKKTLPPSVDSHSRILALKYASKQIGRMSETELMLHAKALLLKISVITGWIIPDNEKQDILVGQFKMKLIEDCETVNVDEIEYAFRKYGTTVEDWGKQMNLNLVDKVLIPYLSERMEASFAEERKAAPPEQKIYTEDQILNERRGHIEMAFQAMRRGNYPVLHEYFPEVLHHDGFIEEPTEELMNELFVLALNTGRENIYEKQQP